MDIRAAPHGVHARRAHTPALPTQSGGGGFDALQGAFTTFLSCVPNVIGALLVLLIGDVIARLLRAAITKLLQKVRLDQRLAHGSGGEYVARYSPDGSPAKLVGLVVQWVPLVFVIVSAVGTLDIPAVTGFVNLVLSYLPNVLAALLIFLVAAAIAEVIVNATYIALIGAVALGSALASGLGGRDAAKDLIDSGYRSARQQSDQVQRDLQTGRRRAQGEARQYTPGDGGLTRAQVAEPAFPAGPTDPNGIPTTGATPR